MSRGLKVGSMTDQISRLKIGETFSRSVMLRASSANDDWKAVIEAKKQKLRNIMTKQIGRVTDQRPDYRLRLDTGVWLAPEDASVFVTVAVTRTPL